MPDALAAELVRALFATGSLCIPRGSRQKPLRILSNGFLTRWFHLTADLQIVDNQNVADDTAIIAGFRANIDP
jgi:hypothetical protein